MAVMSVTAFVVVAAGTVRVSTKNCSVHSGRGAPDYGRFAGGRTIAAEPRMPWWGGMFRQSISDCDDQSSGFLLCCHRSHSVGCQATGVSRLRQSTDPRVWVGNGRCPFVCFVLIRQCRAHGLSRNASRGESVGLAIYPLVHRSSDVITSLSAMTSERFRILESLSTNECCVVVAAIVIAEKDAGTRTVRSLFSFLCSPLDVFCFDCNSIRGAILCIV